MSKLTHACLALIATALAAGELHAQVVISSPNVGVRVGGPPVVMSPQPVFFAPQPVVFGPQPVVFGPQPVMIAPRPVVVHQPTVVRYRGWGAPRRFYSPRFRRW